MKEVEASSKDVKPHHDKAHSLHIVCKGANINSCESAHRCSNIMNNGPSIIRRPVFEKSNVELITALRSNFLASKQVFALHVNGNTAPIRPGVSTNAEVTKVHYAKWTLRKENCLFVPATDFSQSGLSEERSQYDITVKLFFLPNTTAAQRCKHAQEAMSLVLEELHMPSIDLLIVSFPGITFDADDDEDEEEQPQGARTGETEDLDSLVETWKALEFLHEQGLALQIGLSEFSSERLQKFLPRTKVRPSVDQINVKDCCVVPPDLIKYAKQEKIELLTHNDCTYVLPSGTVQDLLGTGDNGAGVLAGPDDNSDGLKGEVEPQWVIKYTAVVRDRGVIENKGYFAMAEIKD